MGQEAAFPGEASSSAEGVGRRATTVEPPAPKRTLPRAKRNRHGQRRLAKLGPAEEDHAGGRRDRDRVDEVLSTTPARNESGHEEARVRLAGDEARVHGREPEEEEEESVHAGTRP